MSVFFYSLMKKTKFRHDFWTLNTFKLHALLWCYKWTTLRSRTGSCAALSPSLQTLGASGLVLFRLDVDDVCAYPFYFHGNLNLLVWDVQGSKLLGIRKSDKSDDARRISLKFPVLPVGSLTEDDSDPLIKRLGSQATSMLQFILIFDSIFTLL